MRRTTARVSISETRAYDRSRSSAASHTRAWFRAGILLTFATLSVACADVPAAFGPTTAAARANTDELFGGLANRFTNVTRAERYERARELIGRYALTPSSIYNDTSIWTAQGTDGTRTLFGDAEYNNGKYVFVNAVRSNALTKAGDGRHIMRLTKLEHDGEYAWFTSVDFAAGSVTAQDIHHVVTRWLASAEGRSPAAIRADSRAAFPRTTAALGKLFTLDTLISVRDANGGNTIYLGMRMSPDDIRDALPNYAAYLDKYIKRVNLRFILTDKTGAKWFDASAHNGYFVMRMRSANGHFAPLEGPIREMPDSLVLQLDATAKISLFTVGVHHLTGDWVNIQTEHERGWALRFTKEPEWQLPPMVGHLIRSPLHRPFDDPGTQFSISFHDQPGGPTLLSRRSSLAVQESAVIRFLGKLGGTAMGDFVAKAEVEENRFDASVFSALRDDCDALLR
jgi:hypothetical protein